MPMVAMFMGQSPMQPPPVPTTHGPSDHTPLENSEAFGYSEKNYEPKARRSTKSAKRQPKAAAKKTTTEGRDNKALYESITALTKSGNIEAAIAKAEGLGWQDHADRLRRKMAEAAQSGTQSLTRRAKTQSKTEKALADKVADQILEAASPQEPKATGKPSKAKSPKVTSKGRPASERCSIHNVFRNAEGVCKKCGEEPKAPETPAPEPKAPKAPRSPRKPKASSPTTGEEPKAPTGKVTKVTDLADVKSLGSSIPLEGFPEGVLTEGDLAIHWGNLANAKHWDILRAALSACRQATVEPRPKAEKVIWAKRSNTLRNILGPKA